MTCSSLKHDMKPFKRNISVCEPLCQDKLQKLKICFLLKRKTIYLGLLRNHQPNALSQGTLPGNEVRAQSGRHGEHCLLLDLFHVSSCSDPLANQLTWSLTQTSTITVYTSQLEPSRMQVIIYCGGMKCYKPYIRDPVSIPHP